MARRSKRVTTADVARLAGVGQMTVSRALTGKGPVAPATRSKILHAVKALGYRHNTAAAAMISGRLGTVALLTGSRLSLNLLPQAMLHAVDEVLGRHNIHLSFARVDEEAVARTGTAPKILRSWMADGLLINYNARIPPTLIKEAGALPAIWMNSKHAWDCVYSDDRAAGAEAVRHLVERGHRRIAFLVPAEPGPGGVLELHASHFHYSLEDRLAGYQEAMAAAGLRPQVHLAYLRLGGVEHLDQVKALLDDKQRPTAVICYSEALVASVCFVAAQLGLRLPRDLSILAFGPEDVLGGGLPVDAMRVPHRALGTEAAEAMLRKLDAPSLPLTPRVLPLRYVPGLTCAPPPTPTRS